MPKHSHRRSTTTHSRRHRWPPWLAGAGLVLMVSLVVFLVVRVSRPSLLDKFEQIEHEMSREEVEALLGQPTRVTTRVEVIQELETPVDILQWVVADAPHVIHIELIGDKVIAKKLAVEGE